MSLFRRHRWFVAAAATIVAYGSVSLIVGKGNRLTAFSDIFCLLITLLAGVVTFDNVRCRPGPERSFWVLMMTGFALWTCNQGAWLYYELFLHHRPPDPCFFDVILFFHTVPMVAAISWRPDLRKKEGRFPTRLINFLTLVGGWVFLYAFIVFPSQYVLLDIDRYNRDYDILYLLENGLFMAVAFLASLTSAGAWRRLYLHFLGVAVVYGVGSQFLDRAVVNGRYFSGSLYDIPLIGAIAWITAVSLSAREWGLESMANHLNAHWRRLIPQLAMLVILSLPVLGLWAVFVDNSPPVRREFRIFSVLTAMLVLGTFVFLRQFLQDQALIGILADSRRGYDSQRRLQSQLVQKEKLASLGALVAGAAHEINHPLAAIMTHSEHLWAKEKLTEQQNSLLRKIVAQAHRTRDLVADLLSFAQQAPGEKILVDLRLLLQRASQMLESRNAGRGIEVNISIEPNLPRVQGNANQLFQSFVEIIENAMDALKEAGGGSLVITAQQLGNEVLLQFSDSGPGIREPERVFDPFYTTKPVGKGSGLGLSAVYGVIQEHNGHISCQNKPEGGALFILRFPVAACSQAQADAAGA
jgi:signal transduction histidine kinase